MSPKQVELKEHLTINLIRRSEPLTITALIVKSGYVCGEVINIMITYKNLSTVAITRTTARLNKMLQYHSDTTETCCGPSSRTLDENIHLCEVVGQGCGGIEDKHFLMSLPIPATVISTKGFCRVLVTAYNLKITATTEGLHHNLSLNIPIGNRYIKNSR